MKQRQGPFCMCESGVDMQSITGILSLMANEFLAWSILLSKWASFLVNYISVVHEVLNRYSKVNIIVKLETLKVSSDLLYNVKKGQGQLRLIIEAYFVLPYVGVAAILVKWPKIIKRICHMKLKLKQSSDFWVYEAVQMSGLGWKVTGQLNIYIKPLSHSVKHFSQVT